MIRQQDATNEERIALERSEGIRLIEYMRQRHPLPSGYDYQVTIFNRLRLNPTVALLIQPEHSTSTKDAVDMVSVDLNEHADVLDAIRFLRSEAEKGKLDMRDAITPTQDAH